MWVDDNNGWLPPGEKSAFGLWSGQRPAYQETASYKYDLAYYLSTYLYFDHHVATRKLGKPGSFY